MTEQERNEIRQIIKEEIDAKLTVNKPAASKEVPSQEVSNVRNEVKSHVNVETVSPTY
jgi:hypothetical protein